MNFEEDYFTTSLNQDEFNDEDLKRRTKKKEVALFRRRRHWTRIGNESRRWIEN